MCMAKESAHEQILKQVPENLLIKIAVTENEKSIQWHEEGKEFQLNGEMYDVVKVKYENGQKYLLCLSDTKEDRIFEALEKVVKSNIDNSTNNDKQHTVTKVSLPEWIFDLQESGQPQKDFSYNESKYFDYKAALSYNFIEINSPPPNFYILN